MHCHQRGGTTGLNRHARAGNIQAVSQLGRQMIFVIADHDLETTELCKLVWVVHQVSKQIEAGTHARI